MLCVQPSGYADSPTLRPWPWLTPLWALATTFCLICDVALITCDAFNALRDDSHRFGLEHMSTAQAACPAKVHNIAMACRVLMGLPIDVNQADEQMLKDVSGMRPQLARSIVAHRQRFGPFDSSRSVKRVRGFGPVAQRRLLDDKNPRLCWHDTCETQSQDALALSAYCHVDCDGGRQ